MGKVKKVSATIMAFVLVLCVGYFSVMSPTSAWFYDNGVIDSGDSFIFGDLSVNTSFNIKDSVVFDGATKFADTAEILFDEVINIDEVNVVNSGTVPARIYVNVENKGTSRGLHWFAFTDDMLVDGSVKKTIQSVLPELTDAALNEYNRGANGNDGHYILCFPGEIVTLKIATWVEYDAVKKSLENGLVLDGYNVEITLTATQDKDGAF